MSKVILIILIVFCAYLFVNISLDAKAEIVKQTFAIPSKTISALQQFTNQGDK